MHDFVRVLRKYKPDFDCMAHAKRLLPYYFSPNALLQNVSVVNVFFAKLMAGIDNKEEWPQTAGLKMSTMDWGFEKLLLFKRV